MSELGHIYNATPLVYSGGELTDASIELSLQNIEDSFEELEGIIGANNGNGLSAHSDTFTNSAFPTVGSAIDGDQSEPYGQYFVEWEDIVATSRKEHTLSLNVDKSNPSLIVIDSPSDIGITWSMVGNKASLSSPGHFHIEGRQILFYRKPSGPFSVKYNGTYPSSGLNSGYTPNLFPSPNVLDAGKTVKPIVTEVSTLNYEVEIQNLYMTSNGVEVDLGLDPSILGQLQDFVDPLGLTECPLEYISLWKKVGSRYKRIEVTSARIISSTKYAFSTQSALNLLDTHIVALTNKTLSMTIRDIYSLLRNHSHSNSELIPPVRHSDLSGLIPETTNADIEYAGSNKEDDDHPQYVHREGYDASNTGSYGNALLGDLLIGSSNKNSMFSNLLANSRRLIFGDYSSGPSLGYEQSSDSLLLSRKTVKLSAPIELSINGHQVFDKKTTDSPMVIKPKEYLSKRILIIGEEDLNGDGTGIVKSRIDSAEVAVGKTKITKDGNTTNVTTGIGNLVFDGDITFKKATSEFLEIEGAHIPEDGKVYLGTYDPLHPSDGGYIEVIDNSQLQIKSDKSVRLNSYGKNTGLSIYDDVADKTVVNLYASKNSTGGDATSDVYLESNTADVYLINSTESDVIVDSVTYTWSPTPVVGKTHISNLKQWPRSNLFAKSASLASVSVLSTTLEKKGGIQTGPRSYIYTTSNEGDCPSGLTVVETESGIIFIDSKSATSDCSAVKYSDVSTGQLQAFGSAIIEQDIGAGRNIVAGKNISGESLTITGDSEVSGSSVTRGNLIVGGETTLYKDVTVNAGLIANGKASFGSELSCSTLKVLSGSQFSGSAIFNGPVSITNGISISGSFSMTGSISADGMLRSGSLQSSDAVLSSLIVTSSSSCGSLDVSGRAEITGQITGKSDLSIAGNASVSGSTKLSSLDVSGVSVFNSEIRVLSSLHVNDGEARLSTSGGAILLSAKTLSVQGSVMIESPDFKVIGPSTLSGDTKINGTLTASDSIFNGTMTVNGSIKTDGTIEASTAKITGNLLVQSGMTVTNTSVFDSIICKEELKVGNLQVDKISSTGGIFADSGSLSRVGSLSIAGDIIQADSSKNAIFSAVITANNGIYVYGDLVSTSGMKTGTESSGSTLIGSFLDLHGQNSKLSAGTISTSNINGNERGSTIASSAFGDVSLGALGSILASKKYIRLSDSYFESTAVFKESAIFAGTLYFNKIQRLGAEAGDNTLDITARAAYYS